MLSYSIKFQTLVYIDSAYEINWFTFNTDQQESKYLTIGMEQMITK